MSDFRVEDQMGFLLRLAHQKANANLAARLSPLDLTPPQATVLARLLERGELSQNLLGRLVAMESANIRDVVLRLRRRRLIAAKKSKEDARVVLLNLTPAGLELARSLIPISIESVAATLGALSAHERRALRQLLRKVIDGAAHQRTT
jgi:MarR family transcriptional regulator, lower aerobic nicotinate degradation pathway regulator